MSKQPNIIYLFSDQHRHDALSCAGNPVVQTPNLDRMASEGVRFTRTYCQSPIWAEHYRDTEIPLGPRQPPAFQGVREDMKKDLLEPHLAL